MRAHLNAQEKRAANQREGKHNRRTNRKINRFAIVISSSTKAEMQTIFVCKTQKRNSEKNHCANRNAIRKYRRSQKYSNQRDATK